MKFADPQIIVFLDLETTGLNPTGNLHTAAILEIAMVAVEVPRFREIEHFSTCVARAPGIAPEAGCDAYVTKMHTDSGLFADMRALSMSRQDAERQAVAFYRRHLGGGNRVALAGSNPAFDRRWLDTWMPEVSRLFHYRNLDVNSLFLLKQYLVGVEKSQTKHRALDDCRQAIAGVHDHFNLMARMFGGGAAAK